MDHMKRPKATVLPDSALVPENNLVTPPPKQFTHVVKAEQPYYYTGPQQASPPEGIFEVGTKLVLTSREGAYCHVVDARGLHVSTAFDGLEPISPSGPPVLHLR